jgi:hypothetical protein
MESQLGLEIMLVDNTTIILKNIVVDDGIDCNNRVRWFVPLNATYVHSKVASILFKFDLMMD